MSGKTTEIAFTLTDPISGESLQGNLKVGSYGIEMSFDGYGDHGTQPPHGTPVFIEFYGGHLRVCLWKDINKEDPEVHILDEAKESNRRDE